MKIEMVNENQIRCILSKEDLADRQMKLSELAYGSEKAKSLFQDMIEQANDEFGFEVDDIPLMIEAIPLSGENIILQITKVEYPEELDARFSKFSTGEEDASVAEEVSLFSDMQTADDVLGLFKKMKEKFGKPEEKDTGEAGVEKEENPKPTKKKEVPINLTKMYEVQSIEQLERLSRVLGGYYTGDNDLYKDEKKNRYYLFVRKGAHLPEEFNKVCNIMSEYVSYKKYTSAAEAFFKEHGKLILKGNALQMIGEIAG